MLTKKQQTRFLITMMSCSMMVAMIITVPIIMLPSIIAEFQVSPVTAQWLISGATLASGIMIPVAAYLIKRFPNKHYFFASVFIIAIGSLLTAVAQSFPVLLVGRIIQSLGCGMTIPFANIMLLAAYPKEKHGRVMAIFGLGAMIAPIITPIISGPVIDHLGWQFMFTIILIVSAVVLILGLAFMKNVTETYSEKFSLQPVVLSSVGFCGLLIGMSNLAQHPILSLQSGGALLIGLVTLYFFIRTQLRSSDPLLNLRVFANSKYSAAVIISVLAGLIVLGSGTFLPIFTQSILGHSATAFAMVMLPGSVIMAIIMVFAGRTFDKYGAKIPFICGGAVLVIGCILGILFHENASLFHIAVVSGLLSAGMGFVTVPATTLGLSGLDGKKRVDGSSILNTLRQIANSFAAVFTILVYTVVAQRAGNEITGVRAIYIVYLFVGAVMLITVFKAKYSTEK